MHAASGVDHQHQRQQREHAHPGDGDGEHAGRHPVDDPGRGEGTEDAADAGGGRHQPDLGGRVALLDQAHRHHEEASRSPAGCSSPTTRAACGRRAGARRTGSPRLTCSSGGDRGALARLRATGPCGAGYGDAGDGVRTGVEEERRPARDGVQQPAERTAEQRRDVLAGLVLAERRRQVLVADDGPDRATICGRAGRRPAPTPVSSATTARWGTVRAPSQPATARLP